MFCYVSLLSTSTNQVIITCDTLIKCWPNNWLHMLIKYSILIVDMNNSQINYFIKLMQAVKKNCFSDVHFIWNILALILLLMNFNLKWIWVDMCICINYIRNRRNIFCRLWKKMWIILLNLNNLLTINMKMLILKDIRVK